MADEQTQGVETNLETAPAQGTGVETNTSTAAPVDDPEVKLSALLEENARLTRDRDNYRMAALALKGKKEIEDLDLSDPVQAQAFIQKQIEDRLLQEKQDRAAASVTEYTQKLARENKELKLALASKSVVNGVSSGGGGADNSSVKTGFFSPEQKLALESRWKAQGFKETSFPAMLKQAEEAARRVAPGGV